jgi:hypothetical protein
MMAEFIPQEPGSSAGSGSSSLRPHVLGKLTVEFCWRPEIGHWADGHVCYVGKWPIGKVAWAGRKKGAAEQEAAYINLPGLEECLGFYATEVEARGQVEKSAQYWFANLGIPQLGLAVEA